MLYEKAGFVEKANKMKTQFASKKLTENGFEVLDLYFYTNVPEISDYKSKYRHWRIEPISEYMDNVPLHILKNVVEMMDKGLLFILFKPTIDPILLYELPYLKQKYHKVCVVLAKW